MQCGGVFIWHETASFVWIHELMDFGRILFSLRGEGRTLQFVKFGLILSLQGTATIRIRRSEDIYVPALLVYMSPNTDGRVIKIKYIYFFQQVCNVWVCGSGGGGDYSPIHVCIWQLSPRAPQFPRSQLLLFIDLSLLPHVSHFFSSQDTSFLPPHFTSPKVSLSFPFASPPSSPLSVSVHCRPPPFPLNSLSFTPKVDIHQYWSPSAFR